MILDKNPRKIKEEPLKATLSEAFTFLVSAKQRNFYARLIASLIRHEAQGLGTMAVGINRQGQHVLFYDPEFVAKMSLTELVLTCEHEVLHLLLGHIPRYLNLISGLLDETEKKKFRAVMNVAADCAANELMRAEQDFDKKYGPHFYGSPELTDGRTFLIPETFELPRNDQFEVYQFLLLRKLETIAQKLGGLELTTHMVPINKPKGKGGGKGQGKGKGKQGQAGSGQQGDTQGGSSNGAGEKPQPGNEPGGGPSYAILDQYFNNATGGAHQFWEKELEGLSSEEVQGLADRAGNEAKKLVKQAVRNHGKTRGTLPAHIAELIEVFLAPPKIPWPQVLRNLCTRTRQTKVSRGMARPSRRMYGVPGVLPYPGKAKDRKFTIVWAIDTSGSMSTDDLQLCAEELINLVRLEQDIHLHVMYCDAHLHVTYEVTQLSDIDLELQGRGGTDFNPPFIKARELLSSQNAPDILIYATDGYAPAPHPDNRVPIPVVWLITPTGTIPSPDYGIHIRMEPY